MESSPLSAGFRTLSRWRRMLQVPYTIDCPLMKVLGYDFEEPLFVGAGQIHIRSRTEMHFTMHAVPRDAGEAFKRLAHAQKNPYNTLDQFRVIATEYDGTEWNAGWTAIGLGETLGHHWHLAGPIHSLTTEVEARFAAKTSGIEVIYDRKLRMPLTISMVSTVLMGDLEMLKTIEGGATSLEVAGTKIEFFRDPKLDATWAVAETSEELPHPYAENWVSEPLCFLLGELAFPRLVARNFGDRAMVWLRPSPATKARSTAACILQQDPLSTGKRFWEVYCLILAMITKARNDDGNRNFEAHPLTHYYYEIIQAAQGSNWVRCMTFASAIEGIIKLMTPDSDLQSDYSSESLQSIRTHIEAWNGDDRLRGRILNAVKLAESKGMRQILKALKNSGVINADHIGSWNTVRNQVMHGTLVSPWEEQELDLRMNVLAEMMHCLSMRYVEMYSI